MKTQASFEGFEPLVRRIYAYVAFVVGEGAIADEVTTRTFDFAEEHRRVLEAEKEPVSWLVEVAHDLLGSRAGAAWAGAQPGDLREIVRALDPLEREVVAMRYGAELSGPEIARVLKKSAAEVDEILYRAGREISEALGQARKEIPAIPVLGDESRNG